MRNVNRAFSILITSILLFISSCVIAHEDSVYIAQKLTDLRLELDLKTSEIVELNAEISILETEGNTLKDIVGKKEVERDGYKMQWINARDSIRLVQADIDQVSSKYRHLLSTQELLQIEFEDLGKSKDLLNDQLIKNLETIRALDFLLKKSAASIDEYDIMHAELLAASEETNIALENERKRLQRSRRNQSKLAKALSEKESLIALKDTLIKNKEIVHSALIQDIELAEINLNALKDSINTISVENVKLKKKQEDLSTVLNWFLIGLLGVLIVGLALIVYHLFFNDNEFNEGEKQEYDSTQDHLVKDLINQLVFNRIAIKMTKFALIVEFAGVIVLSILLTIYLVNLEIPLLEILNESWIKFFGALGVPMLFFVTLYAVLESRRIEIMKLIGELRGVATK